MMSDLSPAVLAEFFVAENATGEEATRRTGIDKIILGSTIDAFQFDPCGYSANGILEGGYYWTIHVTPEDSFSYASFETNYPTADYHKMLEKVLKIFKPKHFNVAVMANEVNSLKHNRQVLYYFSLT